MKTKDFNKIFFALLFFHLVVLYKPESEVLYYLSKPLLLFSLLAFFIHKNFPVDRSDKFKITTALLLSLLGDVLLMQSGEEYFMGGMAAFFAAHVAYLLFYVRQHLSLMLIPLALGLALALLAVYALYSFIHLPQDLQPYIYSYAAIIGLHLVVATLFAYKYRGKQWLSAVGAMLFVVSDIILAYNKFTESHTYLSMTVMLTYGLAQYCIVISVNDYLKMRQ